MENSIAIGGINDKKLLNILKTSVGFTLLACKWELDDNSIDANSSEIITYLSKNSIIFIDNGKGMSFDSNTGQGTLSNFIEICSDNISNTQRNGKFGIGGSIALMKLSENTDGNITIVTKTADKSSLAYCEVNYQNGCKQKACELLDSDIWSKYSICNSNGTIIKIPISDDTYKYFKTGLETEKLTNNIRFKEGIRYGKYITNGLIKNININSSLYEIKAIDPLFKGNNINYVNFKVGIYMNCEDIKYDNNDNMIFSQNSKIKLIGRSENHLDFKFLVKYNQGGYYKFEYPIKEEAREIEKHELLQTFNYEVTNLSEFTEINLDDNYIFTRKLKKKLGTNEYDYLSDLFTNEIIDSNKNNLLEYLKNTHVQRNNTNITSINCPIPTTGDLDKRYFPFVLRRRIYWSASEKLNDILDYFFGILINKSDIQDKKLHNALFKLIKELNKCLLSKWIEPKRQCKDLTIQEKQNIKKNKDTPETHLTIDKNIVDFFHKSINDSVPEVSKNGKILDDGNVKPNVSNVPESDKISSDEKRVNCNNDIIGIKNLDNNNKSLIEKPNTQSPVTKPNKINGTIKKETIVFKKFSPSIYLMLFNKESDLGLNIVNDNIIVKFGYTSQCPSHRDTGHFGFGLKGPLRIGSVFVKDEMVNFNGRQKHIVEKELYLELSNKGYKFLENSYEIFIAKPENIFDIQNTYINCAKKYLSDSVIIDN